MIYSLYANDTVITQVLLDVIVFLTFELMLAVRNNHIAHVENFIKGLHQKP